MRVPLVIGPVTIPEYAMLGLEQTYEPVEGAVLLRASDGSALKQTAWSKLRTVITGTGWIPDGLAGIDWSSPQLMRASAPQSVWSTSNVITLPAARRGDVGVRGFAIVDDRPVETSVSMAGDTATLGTVSGATSYYAMYWPEFLAYFAPPQQQIDVTGAAVRWRLAGEEA